MSNLLVWIYFLLVQNNHHFNQSKTSFSKRMMLMINDFHTPQASTNILDE